MNFFKNILRFKLVFFITFLAYTLFSINLIFAESVISSSNNLEKVTEIDSNYVVIVGISNGEENFVQENLTAVETLSKYSSSKEEQFSIYKVKKISSLVSNFNDNLTNVKAYSENSPTIVYINKDEEVILVDVINEWFKILYDEEELYINLYEISNNEAEFVKVTSTSGLNLRSEPYIDSEVITVLSYGEVVNVITVLEEWTKVNISGKVGFLNNQYLEIIKNTQEVTNASEYFTEDATEIIEYAKTFLGTPYIFGGTNLETGTDCSGFTYLIFKNFGIELNRSSREQYKNGTFVEKENLQPGDLIFFSNGSENEIFHVAIYIGNNQYIHSADEKTGVIIASLTDPFSTKNYFGARRVL